MDEQGECFVPQSAQHSFLPSDQEWLDTVNQERRRDQTNQVSYEAFEIIMDRIEKEWFELVSIIATKLLMLPETLKMV